MYDIDQYLYRNKTLISAVNQQIKIKHVLENKNKANLVFVYTKMNYNLPLGKLNFAYIKNFKL